MTLTVEELTQQDLSKLSPQELEELFTPEQIQEVLTELGGEDDYQRLIEEQQSRQLDPIRFYKPNKAQDRFHLAQNARGYTSKLRLFEAGNKVGKSASALIEGMSFSRGFRSWLPENHPLYKTPMPIPNLGRIIAEDFPWLKGRWAALAGAFVAMIVGGSGIAESADGSSLSRSRPQLTQNSVPLFLEQLEYCEVG